MMRLATALLGGALLLGSPAIAADDLSFGRFGTIKVIQPSGDPASVAILISGAKGWDDDATASAAALADKGALVLGVDWKAYKAELDRDGASCIYPAADLQGLAQYGEKTLGLKRYFQPILVGIGEGAAAAYPAFAQGPSDTFKGALAAGFCPVLKTVKPMCKGHSPDLHAKATPSGFSYPSASTGLANFVALNGVEGQPCPVGDVAALIAATPDAKAVAADPAVPMPGQIASAYADLAATQTAFEQAQKSGGDSAPSASSQTPSHVDISGLDDLPLTVVPSESTPSSYAIFLTGDGGWAGIDQSISAALAAKGVEVVGFNTLDYFWDAKTPLQTAADVNRVFDAIRASDPAAKVTVIGYSFGAEVAPVFYPELADSSKAMIARMVLLVPGTLAVFEFSSSYWLGDEPTDGDNVADAVRADVKVPFLCIYSSDDDGACPALAANTPANVTTKVLGEGHHFGGDYDALAQIILGT
jgi:type IV secretory pathway VirJ component